MSGDNVFGDGVNIAARLQAEAKPDAICFSKTVNDVIKNKLNLDAQYLAPRQLKNIGRVEVWQVRPIEEARQQAISDLLSAPLELKDDAGGAVGFRSIALVVAALICLVAIVFLVRMAAHKGVPPVAQAGSYKDNPNPRLLKIAAKVKQSMAEGSESPAPDSSKSGAGNGNSAPSAAELQAKLDSLKGTYAFDQAAMFLQGEGKSLPDAANLAQSFADLGDMKRWLDAEVDAATASNKIACSMTVSGAPTEVGIYRDPTGSGYMVETSSGASPVPFTQFTPSNIAAIIQSLMSHPITNPQPRAQSWMGEFQQQYPG